MDAIENNNETQPVSNPLHKRPQMLAVICILTFIWSGYGVLYNFTYALFYDTFKELFTTTEFPSAYKEMKTALLQVLAAGRIFFVAGLVLSFFSLFGAIKMWKLQKKGFHFYTISQIILLMLPLIFIKSGGFQSIDFLITAMFVTMYATHLKIMS
jgi:hypothetical protein